MARNALQTPGETTVYDARDGEDGVQLNKNEHERQESRRPAVRATGFYEEEGEKLSSLFKEAWEKRS